MRILAASALTSTSELRAPSTAIVNFEVGAFTAVPAPTIKPAPARVIKKAASRSEPHRQGLSAKKATSHKAVKKATLKKVVAKRTAKKHLVVKKRHVAKKKHVVKKRHAVKKSSSRAGRSIISIARSKTGSPYRFGATGPSSFDCSGYVGWVYRQAGYSLPRMTRTIYPAVRHVSNPRPGDIVFFINGGHATHVGIYAGGGKMYDSPRSGKTVGLHTMKYYNGTVRYGRP